MKISEWIRTGRRALDLTQQQVAQHMGVTKGNVWAWENDRHLPNYEQMVSLAAFLRQPLPNTGDSNVRPRDEPLRLVPLVDWKQAARWQDEGTDPQPGQAAKRRVPTTVTVKRYTYALEVTGDSMRNPTGLPSFPEGTVIVVEPEMEASPGSFVVMLLPGDDQAVFRQLIREGGRRWLRPLNPQWPMTELPDAAQFCGCVREAIQRFD